ncbi:hypothetical protein H310_00877 [Aphanomyces invadans]|uniref:Mitochondrial splicing suppressor 51-like C-terminal domain-containing protein n=1 Tax=Aphanomyces invadans TaxID=157072 RepID=A0A024URI2_9STRA|nr:hypothetical protein H310_00877 [Aphanomyces invadans]ETW08238.1 hypothetical protein H310_00877 [Aphanomyces invadans]|eukprot:XP_008862043.1 hypothetical protein H310_00877 [Aphanomyces invadans]
MAIRTAWHMAVPPHLRWSSVSMVQRRCFGNAAPLNAWNFPCPICGQMKLGHVLTCSPACETKLATDHSDTHDLLLSLRHDLECARSPSVRHLFRTLEALSLSTSTASWSDLLADAGASSSLRDDPAVTRLVSATFSFVMTLRHFLPALLPDVASMEKAHRVYILGARAEATMPRHLWSMLSPWRLDISLIGNHVPVLPSKPHAPSSFTLSFHNGLFHDLNLPSPDAFVLFNPGLGHPALQSLWQPTLIRMLDSKKPLLLTSFCEEDLHRDICAIEGVRGAGGPRLDISENPFGSTKATVDPLNLLARPVHSNRFVCVVH